MSTHSVAAHLGLRIEDYDREIRRLVPYYDEFVAEGVDLLRSLVAPNARILDLGSGTGRMSRAILAAMQEAQTVLLDVDPETLVQARERLAFAEGRATFVSGSFYDPLPSCDAVVASLSLHHIQERAVKTKVYEAIRATLPKGGPFLCLDAVVSNDEAFSNLTFARWAREMNAHGIEDPEARKHFANWAQQERYFSQYEEFESLREAGFQAPECFWRKGPLSIYGARR